MELKQPRGHGGNNRGIEAGALPGVPFGRFGRMFDKQGVLLSEACLTDLAETMLDDDPGAAFGVEERLDENATIPAAYTYFGQFIDHDITFDPTALNAMSVDVDALVDFRSPALDLDNVYGRGPDDQPYLYGDNGRLALGDAIRPPGDPGGVFVRSDVLRLGSRSADAAAAPLRLAVLGDKRNDENRLVAQIQASMIRFHNRVIASDAMIDRATCFRDDPTFRFRAAVDIVRWHYQWLVVHDYLDRRILKPGTVERVLNPTSARPRLPNYLKLDAEYPYMPVEFSGAAFRFGHSMVRPSYALNAVVGVTAPPGLTAHRVPVFSHLVADAAGHFDTLKNLNGFGLEIPDFWGVDWRFFADDIPGAPAHTPQPSYRIDTMLVSPLRNLPEFEGKAPPIPNLAFRNLMRGVRELRLPSGEQVAEALGLSAAERIPPDKMWTAGSLLFDPADADAPGDDSGNRGKLRDRTTTRQDFLTRHGTEIAGNTPLWFYILREAEYFGVERAPDDPVAIAGGQHLGPVGSQLVAETLIGLLWQDKNSYLNRVPCFRPFTDLMDLGDADAFSLGKLLTWAWKDEGE